MTSFGRMMVLRIRVGFARARRAARNGERKGAFSGGECGFIFYFALARGCARRARGAHRADPRPGFIARVTGSFSVSGGLFVGRIRPSVRVGIGVGAGVLQL